jgi:hypothetical protein
VGTGFAEDGGKRSGVVDVVAAIGDRRVDKRGQPDAYPVSGNIGSLHGDSVSPCAVSSSADEPSDHANRSGDAARCRSLVHIAGSAAAEAGSHLFPAALAARCHSALFPGPERGAGLQCDLCAGIPAERHSDRAAHDLRLASRLAFFARDSSAARPLSCCRCRQANSTIRQARSCRSSTLRRSSQFCETFFASIHDTFRL